VVAHAARGLALEGEEGVRTLDRALALIWTIERSKGQDALEAEAWRRRGALLRALGRAEEAARSDDEARACVQPVKSFHDRLKDDEKPFFASITDNRMPDPSGIMKRILRYLERDPFEPDWNSRAAVVL